MPDPIAHPPVPEDEAIQPDEILPAHSDEMAIALRREGTIAWEQTTAELARSLSGRLTVAFLGSASSGKDSAIRAIFGVDFGEISPIPGSTSSLKVIPLDKDGQVLIVNAPGFGDVRADVDQIARRVLDDLDVVIYVVNSEGGATIDERRDLDAIRARARPVLVCLNKIDLIRTRDREAFISATLEQLGVDRSDAAIAAFDPLPQLSKEPIGVEEVTRWIYAQLAQSGKELLFAKQLRNKSQACEPIIQAAAKRAAVAGAIPVPGADLAVVTAIQVKMIRDIAVVHGADIDKEVAMFIIGELLSGGMRGFVRWGAQALKAAGWIPGTQLAEAGILAIGAMVAGATTFGVGKASVQYFQSGRSLDSAALRMAFDAAAWDYKRKKETMGF